MLRILMIGYLFSIIPVYATINQNITLQQLTLDQKIGQLFMVAVVADPAVNKAFIASQPYNMDPQYVQALIEQYHIGGIIFLGSSSIEKQLHMTKQLTQASQNPLLIGQDLEWGLGMRLSDGITFPHAMTLGALTANNDHLIYELGYSIGLQAQLLGVHINFAPVADVNSNPKNPVINDRSFGSDPSIVTRKSILFAHGLRDAGVIACAKHFPNHGDTSVDSHYDLPTINHSYETIMNNDLHPFKQLIADHIPAVMIGHLAIPALDHTGTPASCSHKIVTDLLKKQLQYAGLIVTDGLGMGALTARYKYPGEVECAALLAGNDLLLCPIDIPAACARIKQAIHDGSLTIAALDEHVMKILTLKSCISQPKKSTINQELVYAQARKLKRTIYDHAITVVKNDDNVLPLAKNSNAVIISITHHNRHNSFAEIMRTQSNCTLFTLDPQQAHNTAMESAIENIRKNIDDSTTIIITLDDMERSCRTRYGITPQIIDCIKQISTWNNNKVLIVFGNPYALSELPTSTIKTIIVAYDREIEAQQATADIIGGTIPAQGILPVQMKPRTRLEQPNAFWGKNKLNSLKQYLAAFNGIN